MFFELEPKDLLVPVALFAVAEIKSYFTRKIAKKQFDKIGKIEAKIDIMGLNNKSKYLYYTAYAIGGVITLLSIFGGIKTLNYKMALSGITYGLSIIYFPYRIKEQLTIHIGDKGFVSKELSCTWEELERIEWDRDIKQSQWGVRFYKKGQIAYHKIYVKREYKEKLEKLIDENFNK
jgi:hypothetical protein